VTYTPGPWEADEDKIWANVPVEQDPDWPGRHCIAATDGPWPMALENAKLIAAAPELLAACEMLCDAERITQGYLDEHALQLLVEATLMAEIAIVKAKGENNESKTE